MSEVADSSPGATATALTDVHDLARFGYKQELHRSLGSFSSFAAGFSYLSILTGVFELFAFGFGFGGPAFFWTWPRPGHGEYFSMGRWGLPVNAFAVLYGILMTVNLAWPRAGVYGTDHWYFRYGAFVFTGVIVAVGLAYYAATQRRREAAAVPAVVSVPAE